MTLPTVTEISLPLEPVAHDPFIDDADDGAGPRRPQAARGPQARTARDRP